MVTDPIFFRDLAYVFVAAVLGGALAWAARQPLILGYVLGGMLVGPFTPGPTVSNVRTFELFADIGVVLLMFSIGIEFSLRDLTRVRWVALVGGPFGIVACAALGVGTGALLGWPPIQGLVVGTVISVASTMVLARLLLDRGDLHARHGRVMLGIALVEDLAVVVLIVLMPALGALEPGRLLAIGLALGKAAAILLPFWYLAAKAVPRILTRVARTQSQELFLLVALAVGLGAAAATQALGLSLALGAFLAGLLISESDYAHETLARLLPLRDVFVAFFFVTLGALIDPAVLVENLRLLGVLVALILVGKLVIRASIVRAFGHPFRTAVLVGVGLAQIGEFSFVLVQVARAAGHVGADVYNATLAAALITILANALLVRWVSGWIGPARPAAPAGPGAGRLTGHVVLCGFGRVGSAIGEALETFRMPYAVIEIDPDAVIELRARGVPAFFGDGSQRRLLEVAGVAQATLVVITIPESTRARLAVRQVHALNGAVPVLARAPHREAIASLIEAGATEVIQPEFEAASTLIRHALRRLDLPRDRVLDYLERYRRAMDEGRDGPGVADQALPVVHEVTMAAGELADQSLREARLRERFGVTVVSLRRSNGETVPHPSANTVLRPGDRVWVFGLPEQIAAFVRAMPTPR
ncbi:MAG: cation:proton antiporter [Candidatus Rokubacteria bacterium]|nr:cation:proton antiporter [Candidatus Rokubacteria bacterium]